MRITLSLDGRRGQDRLLIRQLRHLADERKRIPSPFPFNLLEASLNALLDGLVWIVTRAVCAVIRLPDRR